MFVFMVVPGITACNINPYHIYGVIFKKRNLMKLIIGVYWIIETQAIFLQVDYV